jgi:hypothetical protein
VRHFAKFRMRFRPAALMSGLLCSVLGFAAVPAANVLTVSGSPLAMKITTATAGFPPNSATDVSTFYTSSAKKATSPMKIMASLSAIMPANMTLTISLVAPTGATSDGTVPLDATSRELVGNITNTSTENNTITYTLNATAAAGVVVSQSRIVTFTMLAWP